MNNKTFRIGLLALGLTAVAALPARASSTTYTIKDVGTFGGLQDFTLSDTYGGTGFVGIFPTNSTDLGSLGPSFVHAFGLENYNGVYSETEMQVDISGLSGATVTSAILTYNLLNGTPGSQGVTATSFTTTGLLGYSQTPPNNLGSTTFTSAGHSLNSVDVTTLLQNAVIADQNWFGLFLTPNGPGHNFQYTYTTPLWSANADSADVRLTVIYAIPEPSSFMCLVEMVFLGLVGARFRHRKSRTNGRGTQPRQHGSNRP